MASSLSTSLGRVRVIGRFEGISFLLLLGVAMPLKYAFGMPLAVSIVGGIHGLLFVAYLAAIAEAAVTLEWGAGRISGLVAAAVLPGGPFVAERWWLQEGERP